MSLTPKQEAFAQNVASGKTQADAYRAAYDAAKMKDATIHKRSGELMADGAITGRISELRKQLENKQLWTREMSVKILGKIALDSHASNGEKTSAIKELNVMHGYNAPIQIDALVSMRQLPPVSADEFV
jgi:hypothetical protein